MKPVEVKAYSGYRAEEEPRSFIMEGREFKVKEVLRLYYEYDPRDDKLYRGYRVRAENEEVYELVYDEEEGRWYLKRIKPK